MCTIYSIHIFALPRICTYIIDKNGLKAYDTNCQRDKKTSKKAPLRLNFLEKITRKVERKEGKRLNVRTGKRNMYMYISSSRSFNNFITF